MAIPEAFQSSKYPDTFDTDQNLFLVADALRVVLTEDYDPDVLATKITVSGDTSKFPSTGIITLTEQCSTIKKRAVSFTYTSRTATTFEGLVPLDGFDNTIVRPKNSTYVTQNVMAEHHDNLKNALIAIENFVGIKGTLDTEPLGETMEGRINFLRKLVLRPRAWFTSNKRVGLVPLTVEFLNESFRLGDGNVIVTWDFGDADSTVPISYISTISVTSVVPVESTNVSVIDVEGRRVQKTYNKPGLYKVRVQVENEYGTDYVEFEDFINARLEAPEEAIIQFTSTLDQTVSVGDPSDGPYTTYPKIRSRTNKFIDMYIPEGVHDTTLRTYAGEEIEGTSILDPINAYTWVLSDNLTHSNQNSARASYSIGGLYDLVLRCDTRYGAYRITTYPSVIDIVEEKNLWLFTFSGGSVYGNEFGLISETFKSGDTPYTVLRDASFLNNTNNRTQAVREFKKNASFSINGTVNSGNHGLALIAYAGGGSEGSALSDQVVRMVDFDGFSGTITDNDTTINRPWNWMFFAFDAKAYFLFGPDPSAVADENLSFLAKDEIELGSLFTATRTTLVNPDNFINGSNELLEHVTSTYDGGGEPNNGRFAVYRSARKENTGYFLRNDGVGNFFKLRQFFKTQGTNAEPIINIKKLNDMTGQVKAEGELVSLTNGLFFFNNSGSISAYNTVDAVWEFANSVSPFRVYQDRSVDDYDNRSNTLLAASDGERLAYLSYDYSPNTVVKYNTIDKTFSLVGTRPDGEQWVAGIY